MKTTSALIAVLFAGLALAGQPKESQGGNEVSISQQEEVDLLLDYFYDEDETIASGTIQIYDSNFVLIQEAQINIDSYDNKINSLISQSSLLIDDGNTKIYQIQD